MSPMSVTLPLHCFPSCLISLFFSCSEHIVVCHFSPHTCFTRIMLLVQHMPVNFHTCFVNIIGSNMPSLSPLLYRKQPFVTVSASPYAITIITYGHHCFSLIYITYVAQATTIEGNMLFPSYTCHHIWLRAI